MNLKSCLVHLLSGGGSVIGMRYAQISVGVVHDCPGLETSNRDGNSLRKLP